jgi:hypothetical protein
MEVAEVCPPHHDPGSSTVLAADERHLEPCLAFLRPFYLPYKHTLALRLLSAPQLLIGLEYLATVLCTDDAATSALIAPTELA